MKQRRKQQLVGLGVLTTFVIFMAWAAASRAEGMTGVCIQNNVTCLQQKLEYLEDLIYFSGTARRRLEDQVEDLEDKVAFLESEVNWLVSEAAQHERELENHKDDRFRHTY